jgi:Zn-dependent M28 family amino/carboxypeptidase
VAFGARIPGSVAIEETRVMICDTLNSGGNWNIKFQNFSKEWINDENVTLVNMEISPSTLDLNQPYFLLLAHYDSRRWADQDSNPALRKNPVMGANDGASGVAVALELGRVLLEHHQISNFKIILFDAEDQGNIGWGWLVGSKYYVKSDMFDKEKILFAILFDMVGGHNAIFKREGNSDQSAPSLVSEIWNTADNLGYEEFFVNRSWGSIIDDHLPFIQEGVPAVDIIDDFGGNYKAWHTTSDTIDQINGSTLNAVGKTVEFVLHKIYQNPDSFFPLPSFTYKTDLLLWNSLIPLFLIAIPYLLKKDSRI